MADQQQSAATSSIFALVVRSYWIALGWFGVFLAGALIFAKGLHASIAVNGAYALLVVTIVVARYFDIRFYAGETSDNKPSTMADWRRFTWVTMGCTLAYWLVAQGLARLIA